MEKNDLAPRLFKTKVTLINFFNFDKKNFRVQKKQIKRFQK